MPTDRPTEDPQTPALPPNSAVDGPATPLAPEDTEPPGAPRPAPNPLADRIRDYLDAWRGWEMAAAILKVLAEHQVVTWDSVSGSCYDCCTGCPLTMCQSCGGGDDEGECVTIQVIARALRIDNNRPERTGADV